VVIARPASVVSLALQSITQDIAARVSVAAVQQNNFIPINLIG
jgi:hypothetical protein